MCKMSYIKCTKRVVHKMQIMVFGQLAKISVENVTRVFTLHQA